MDLREFRFNGRVPKNHRIVGSKDRLKNPPRVRGEFLAAALETEKA